MRAFLLAPAMLLISGCSGSGDESSSSSSPSSSSSSSSSGWTIETPKEFEVFGDMSKAWQGNWVVRNQSKMQAWQVNGRNVTVFDGKEEKAYTLGFNGPCKASITSATDTGVVGLMVGFSVLGDQIHTPLRQSSHWDGEHFAGCLSGGHLLYYDANSCVYFDANLPRNKTTSWTRQEVECEVKEGSTGNKYLSYKTASMRKPKSAGGFIDSVDQLSEENRERYMAKRFDDFAAAKAALSQ